jgi:PilZ domain
MSAHHPPGGAPGHDRRAAPRYRCNPPRVVPALVGPAFDLRRASLEDLSATGAGLAFPGCLDPGTELFVLLAGCRGSSPRSPLARVVRVARRERRGCRAGCRFHRRLILQR